MPDFIEKRAHVPTRPRAHDHLVELHSLPIRILHWNSVFIIFTLIITGLFLHYPLGIELPLRAVRQTKGIFNFLLIVNTSIYIYYSLITKHYTNLIFSSRDFKFIPSFTRYMLFLKEEPGYYGKYNPGQKATYSLWLLLILTQITTGLLLFYPEHLGFFIWQVGGLNKIRLVHYFVTWLFIATIPIHLYLAITEDPAKLQSIFTGWGRK